MRCFFIFTFTCLFPLFQSRQHKAGSAGTTPTSQQVLAQLQNEHPNWSISEKRVKKFVKRHTAGHANPAGADDDLTLDSTMSSSSTKLKFSKFRKGVRNLFRSSKKSSIHESGTPIQMIEPIVEERAVLGEPEVETLQTEDSTKAVEEGEFPEAIDVYHDDNTGKKDCCECATCIVM